MFQAEGMDGTKFLSRKQREKKLPSNRVINFSVQKPLLKFVCIQKQKIWSFKKILYNCLHFLPWDSIKHSARATLHSVTGGGQYQGTQGNQKSSLRGKGDTEKGDLWKTHCLTHNLPLIQKEFQIQVWEQWAGMCSGHSSSSPHVSLTASLLSDRLTSVCS